MPARISRSLRWWQLGLFAAVLVVWHVGTSPTLLPPIYFDNPDKAAFFFGEPLKVFERVWDWFSSGSIYRHLWVTLLETLMAFIVGTVLGLAMGLWLALSPTASALFDPYIKALNSMPRVILAPIFAVWFGLDIGSKVALGVTLVFFIVFFNVYQGVREVSHTVLANARILGASERQLLRRDDGAGRGGAADGGRPRVASQAADAAADGGSALGRVAAALRGERLSLEGFFAPLSPRGRGGKAP